jgi:hypothetical protein
LLWGWIPSISLSGSASAFEKDDVSIGFLRGIISARLWFVDLRFFTQNYEVGCDEQHSEYFSKLIKIRMSVVSSSDILQKILTIKFFRVNISFAAKSANNSQPFVCPMTLPRSNELYNLIYKALFNE